MQKYLMLTSVSLIALAANCHANDNEFKFDVDSRIMLDGDYLSDWYDQDDQFSGEVRRLKSSLTLKNQDWLFKVKLGIDVDNEELDVDDAFIQYRGWDWGKIKLGKHKEPFGLELSTSSSQLATIERAMASNLFAPGRNYGVSLKGQADNLNWWVGIFDNESFDTDAYGITGRATYQLFDNVSETFHIGASFSQRQLNGVELDSKSSYEIHSIDDVLDSKKLAMDELFLFGTEAQWSNGNLKLAAEWMTQTFTLTDSGLDITHTGLYGQASYLFGDASYQFNNGKLATPKLSKKRNIWELVSRYSQLDTLESDNGSDVENWTLGLNYYYGKRIKIMTGVTHSKTVSPVEQDGMALSLRFQYSL